MSASVHQRLIALTHKLVGSLPSPMLRALDAWSQRVARRRALERQRKWLAQKQARAAAIAATAARGS